MVTVTRLEAATIEAAGALVAREHAAARAALPGLPAGPASPAWCADALWRLLDDGHLGAVAFDRGRALAVMTARARGGGSDTARLPAEGFAVDPEIDDPTTPLAWLYGTLAPELLAAGSTRHYLDHLALPRLHPALANLGFGRHHLYGTRPAEPRPHPVGVEVRVAGPDDLRAVAWLALVELRFRATPPIYGPPDHSTVEEVAAGQQALRDRGAIHLVAAVNGRDVGLLTIELTSPAPRLCPDGQPYIGPTATLPEARGIGVGRALVDTALTWAHRHGHRWVSVDFEPANPLSRPFWLGNGFRPVGYCVLRSIHPGYLPPGPGQRQG